MKKVLLGFVMAITVIFSLYGIADSSTVFQTVQQIQSGVVEGRYQNLSASQKQAFETALTTARDTLYGSSSVGKNQFTCVNQGNNYYAIVNTDSGRPIGKSIFTKSACDNLLPDSGNTMTCVSAGDNYYQMANLLTEVLLGKPVFTQSACKALLPTAGTKFLCAPTGDNYYQVTNLNTGATLGAPLFTLTACQNQIP